MKENDKGSVELPKGMLEDLAGVSGELPAELADALAAKPGAETPTPQPSEPPEPEPPRSMKRLTEPTEEERRQGLLKELMGELPGTELGKQMLAGRLNSHELNDLLCWVRSSRQPLPQDYCKSIWAQRWWQVLTGLMGLFLLLVVVSRIAGSREDKATAALLKEVRAIKEACVLSMMTELNIMKRKNSAYIDRLSVAVTELTSTVRSMRESQKVTSVDASKIVEEFSTMLDNRQDGLLKMLEVERELAKTESDTADKNLSGLIDAQDEIKKLKEALAAKANAPVEAPPPPPAKAPPLAKEKSDAERELEDLQKLEGFKEAHPAASDFE